MASTMMMTPYLHTAGGDALYFRAWTPTSTGAIAGACIGLVALAIFERWIAAMRSVAERHWRGRALASDIQSRSQQSLLDDGTPREQKAVAVPRTVAPFIASHDLARGALHALQSALGYALMLAVMTFQVGYVVSIIVGLGLGELAFGRYGGGYSH